MGIKILLKIIKGFMFKLLQNYNRLFIILIFLLIITPLYAQKDIDSILTNATLKIFEDPDSAIEEGLEIYRNSETSSSQKIRALILISTGYSSKRDYEKSLEYALLAKNNFNDDNISALKIRTLNKIGVQYQQLKIYDKAIEYLDEALKLTTSYSKGEDSIASLLGYNYIIRGFIYREQMSCDIALNYFNKSLSHYKKIVASNTMMNANLSTLTYNKGNCFIMLKQIDSAKISFNESITYAKKVDANSLQGFAQKGLGEVYTIEGNHQQAILILNEAIATSKEVGDLILNQGLYESLANNYLALNLLQDHQKFYNKFLETQSLIKETKRKTINQSISHVLEENKKEIDQSKSHSFKIRLLLIIVITISIFILLFLIKRSEKNLKKFKSKLQLLRK